MNLERGLVEKQREEPSEDATKGEGFLGERRGVVQNGDGCDRAVDGLSKKKGLNTIGREISAPSRSILPFYFRRRGGGS